jgi:phosphoglycerate dehydrogenase-like enzyme
MKRLLILEKNAPTYVEEVTGRNLPDLEIFSACSVDEGSRYISEADIILGRPEFVAPLLSQASKLQWVQSTFAGIEPFCADELRKDYMLTGVKDVFGPLMSEYVFAYILALERNLWATLQNQQEKNWSPISYVGLDNKTIGIVGLGSIGSHIARTAAFFGMRVLGLKRTKSSIDHVAQLFTPAEIESFLPLLDYLVLILPDTAASQHFIGMGELKSMKETAILMNVGRGSAVNQLDLVSALQQGYIRGAVLDVFEEEPLPKDSPLWSMPNVYITPHNAAFSFPEQITTIFCDNYLRFLDAKPLKYMVDFTTGY